MTNQLYEIPLKTIKNADTTLNEYNGKVLLIVNVASECGLTPQYEALESVYEKYHDQGLEVLGFPANEFEAQEPGTNEQINEFCKTKYSIKFPMFSKIVVKGEGKHPLYTHLTDAQPQAKIKDGEPLKNALAGEGLVTGQPKEILWNFEKFLVNRKGEVIDRFAPDITPDDPVIISAIEAELKK